LISDLVHDEIIEDLNAAIVEINETLPPGASDRKLPGEFFSSIASAKAATIMTFILTFSEAVFHGILSSQEYTLWCQFVRCCRVFFALEVTISLVDEVEHLYAEFLRAYMSLYPGAVINFNFHISLHIAENMRQFGPNYTSWW
jgi:hypothetical protein